MRTLAGVDVGGTFTDVALVHEGRLTAVKLPTTIDDQSRAVIEGVERALEQAGLAPRALGHLGHGTTVATNALLERRGAVTGFVATRGFGDLLALARQTRPLLYRPCVARPAPLPELTVEVDERMGPDGVLRALDERSVERAARALRRAGVEAVAICLLHAYAHPQHERRVAELLRSQLEGVFVVASHELAAEYREFERGSTTSIDAYLGPSAGRYLRSLGEQSAAHGLPQPLVMQSSGGLAPLAEAAGHPARLLLSGPAGGVAAAVGMGAGDAVAFDMGGTSCDVSLIREGRPGRSTEREVAGLPVRLPMLDIHTVGAGGGSIAWIDDGGALRVGPQSAGADPGPACYGRGGGLPTVTDANLVLGRLDAAVPLAGSVGLDAKAARRAVATVADGFASVRAAAAGIVAVANQEMVRAIRVVSVERGHDPRGFELIAFGGAGPLHACEVAEELGMRSVRVPAASGVLSALGIAAGERRRDAVRSVMRPLEGLTRSQIRSQVPWPQAERGSAAVGGGRPALRGAGVRAGGRPGAAGDAGRAVPRATRRAVRPRAARDADRAGQPAGCQHRGRAGAGAGACPAEAAGARAGNAASGWSDAVGGAGLDGARSRRRRLAGDAMSDPATLQVLASALRGVAEEMGAALIRAAHSANIKERRDCSTALFDLDGRMIAQAEHIPVHLGAMPDAVAAVLELDPEPGTVFVLNDPFTGGTHLPDITLVSRAEDLGLLVSRAHHADVGGMWPGSLPAHSREIFQEGLVIPPLPLTDEVLRLMLANMRNPEQRAADLRAQLSSHAIGAQRLGELAERFGRRACCGAWTSCTAMPSGGCGRRSGGCRTGATRRATWWRSWRARRRSGRR